jgi:hypothetical protein
MQKISDVSACVASLMWIRWKWETCLTANRLPSIWMLILVGSQSSF